jgi:catalase
MSLKFHDTNGDYDMISQSIPVFFINDVHDFKALADALTVNTAFDGINREAAWRFILAHPESANCFLRMFSYEGLLDSFIYAKWFSVNSCVWVNSYDKRRSVRYKWVPVTKMVHKKSNNKTRINAEFMSGFDPEVAGTELRDALLTGDFPQYHLIVQIALKETEDKNTICWDDEKNVEEIEAGVLKITSLEDKELNFDIGRIVKGIMPKEDDFIKYMTFAHRLGCAERGHKV